ncbi:uncharacterized protein BJ171DRAFT_31552 [Polychytrium aggregatum]|uniref:uncharacterized protein n=1 Tax=Polychytrium aggregatum TaxID=110093 RepID=UPI0022FE89F9|nr:uncharacterized protein BJ171DRAFT_31552 [Polychytrium aggregatum]KAI9206492.1 hypothetical protein BJ171DRAFT_31552 [Polychytrium aggregatum]
MPFWQRHRGFMQMHDAEASPVHSPSEASPTIVSLKSSVASLLKKPWQEPHRTDLRRLAKVTLAYIVAMSAIMFTPLGKILGTCSCFVITAIVFVAPTRSVGAMLKSSLHSLAAIAIGLVISVSFLYSSYLLSTLDSSEKWVAKFMTIGGLFVVVYLIAFVNIRYSSPNVSTGCLFAYNLTFLTSTQIANAAVTIDLLLRTTQTTAMALLTGLGISLVCCCLVWPESASSQAEDHIRKILNNFKKVIITVKNRPSLIFRSPQAEDTVVTNPEELKSLSQMTALQQSHEKTLLSLETTRVEVLFEPFSKIFMHLRIFNAIFNRFEHLTQHVGSLISSFRSIESNHECGEVIYTQFRESLSESLEKVMQRCMDALDLVSFQLLGRKDADSSITRSSNDQIEDVLVSLQKAIKDFEERQEHELEVLFRIHKEKMMPIYFFSSKLVEFSNEILELALAASNAHQAIQARKSHGSLLWCFQNFSLSSILRIRKDRKAARHRERQLNIEFANASRAPARLRYFKYIKQYFKGFDKFHVKYALKTAITISLLALPSFLERYQLAYYEYRLYWMLTTVTIVISPSVGASNIAGLNSILGSILGAALAAGVWMICSANLVQLCLVSVALVVLPLYYNIRNSKYSKIGSISLMTYNVVLLQALGATQNVVISDDFSIKNIAYLRGLSNLIGVAVGLSVSWFIWPYKAKTQIRIILSEALSSMSILYIKNCEIFGTPSGEPGYVDVEVFRQVEVSVRMKLTEFRKLAVMTKHESPIKDDRNMELYNRIADGCERILNKFAAMRLRPSDAYLSQVATDLVRPIQTHRQEFIGQILLIFHVLSGSMRLKNPMPPRLPQIETTRDNVLGAIRKLPMIVALEKGETQTIQKIHCYYYYAYILEMALVVNEVSAIWDSMKTLFGEINYWRKTK